MDKQFSPSAARNTEPILAALRPRLPASGRALELASGTGQHIAAFAAAFPRMDWTPSDPDPAARASIAAHVAEAGLANLHAPLDLDVIDPAWPEAVEAGLDVMVAINLLHISPWAATLGLLSGAGRLLAPEGRLVIYGPFSRGGDYLSQSNVQFDAALRHRDPSWGLRDVDDVATAARAEGLDLAEIIAMPANNLMLMLTRA
jgi:SAM-dependent methyltransferase